MQLSPAEEGLSETAVRAWKSLSMGVTIISHFISLVFYFANLLSQTGRNWFITIQQSSTRHVRVKKIQCLAHMVYTLRSVCVCCRHLRRSIGG